MTFRVRDQLSAIERGLIAKIEENQKVHEETVKVLRERKTVWKTVGFIAERLTDGSIRYHESRRPCGIPYPVPGWPYTFDAVVVSSPEAKGWIEEMEKQKEAAVLEARRLAVIAMEKQEAEQMAEEAGKERLGAQVIQYVEKIGGTLAARFKDGYCTPREIIRMIKANELTARDLTYTEDWDRQETERYSGGLSDDQYLALQLFRSKLPSGTEVNIDEGYDPEITGEDDGLENGRFNRLLIAVARWAVGEVWVRADALIGELPNEVD